MAYDSKKKPASMVVPVQKKARVSAPPGMRGQQQETSVPSGQEQTQSNKPATEDDWLMKSGLFTGQHLLQRLYSPVSESSESELATGLGMVEQSQVETVPGSETAIPHSCSDVRRSLSRAFDDHGESNLPTPQSLPLQAKLTIGEPGDKYEQEADRVASQVVEQINSPASAQSTQGQSVQRQEGAEEELQRQPSISILQRSQLPQEVQREAMPEGEELQASSLLQRREAIAGGEASTDLDTAINSARGGGQPLDAGLQQSMGQAMGADFSGVRVHTDAQSDQLNQSIQAKAFTTGQDVFFRQGAYDPGSRGGQELIAHELTHVVQQKSVARIQRQTVIYILGMKLSLEEIAEEWKQRNYYQMSEEALSETKREISALDEGGLNEDEVILMHNIKDKLHNAEKLRSYKKQSGEGWYEKYDYHPGEGTSLHDLVYLVINDAMKAQTAISGMRYDPIFKYNPETQIAYCLQECRDDTEDILALCLYTSYFYEPLNKYFRGQSQPDTSSNYGKLIQKTAEVLRKTYEEEDATDIAERRYRLELKSGWIKENESELELKALTSTHPNLEGVKMMWGDVARGTFGEYDSLALLTFEGTAKIKRPEKKYFPGESEDLMGPDTKYSVRDSYVIRGKIPEIGYREIRVFRLSNVSSERTTEDRLNFSDVVNE